MLDLNSQVDQVETFEVDVSSSLSSWPTQGVRAFHNAAMPLSRLNFFQNIMTSDVIYVTKDVTPVQTVVT